MKILQSIFLILITFTLTNCSNNKVESQLNDDYELSSKIAIENTNNKISTLFFNAGISNIEMTKNGEIFTFKPINGSNTNFNDRKILINGFDVNLMDYEVNLENGQLSLKRNQNLQITLKNNKPYIINDDFSGFLEDDSDFFQNKDANVLLVYLNELSTTLDYKVSYIEKLSEIEQSEYNLRGCSFWDTYYSAGAGLNGAAAESNFEFNNADDLSSGGDLESCTPIGEPEHDDYGVVHFVTQAYCCR